MILSNRKICTIFIVALAIESLVVCFVTKNEYVQNNKNIRIQLDKVTERLHRSVNETFSILSYNIDRTEGFFENRNDYTSTTEYTDFLSIETNPIVNSFDSFIWCPLISVDNLSDYNSFGENNIATTFMVKEFNETSFKMIPVQKRDFYVPLSLFSPKLQGANQILEGFDILSHPATEFFVNFNKTSYVNTGLTLQSTIFNSFAIMVNRRVTNKHTKSTKGFILTVFEPVGAINRVLFFDRQDISIFIYDEGNGNLIYKEPDINANTTEQLEKLFPKEDINTINISVVDTNLTYKLIYSRSYSNSFSSDSWKIILISLIALFFIIDLVTIIVVMRFATIIHQRESETKEKKKTNSMLGYVNHELRNPLQALMGLIDDSVYKLQTYFNLGDGTTNEYVEVIQSNLETAYSSAKIMNHIMNDILDIRKLTEGKIEIEIEKVNLLKFWKKFRKIIKPKIEERRLKLDIEIEDGEIETDEYRLTQILMNLLSNAVKYTRTKILVKCIQDEEYLTIIVLDDGMGIDEDVKPHIFKPFEATNKQDVTRHGGVGLGLYICKMVSKLLKSDIKFYSKKGTGTMFYIHLPKHYNADKPFPDIEDPFFDKVLSDGNIELQGVIIDDKKCGGGDE